MFEWCQYSINGVNNYIKSKPAETFKVVNVKLNGSIEIDGKPLSEGKHEVKAETIALFHQVSEEQYNLIFMDRLSDETLKKIRLKGQWPIKTSKTEVNIV